MGNDRSYARLPTEGERREAAQLDALPARAVVELLIQREQESLAAVVKVAGKIARVAEAVARALDDGGRLIYVGAGTSGRLGVLDASECPPTFGTRPSQVVGVIAGGKRALTRSVEGAEDRGEDARAALTRLRIDAKDVVVGIAASGVTPFAREALDFARAAGAFTALVTCAPRAARAARVDVLVGLDVGAEVVSGSTRLGAGTATKIALNAITTAAMVRTGRVWGSSMVDVRATNAKLRARARRLVEKHTTLRGEAAEALLARAGGEVKLAIVMARLQLSAREARKRLAAARGRLRQLLGAP